MRPQSLLAALACLIAAAPLARAQDARPLPSTPILLPAGAGALNELSGAERQQLDAWVEGMRKWQRMDKHWHNQPAHDVLGRVVDRVPEPPPPDWLEARCKALGPAAPASAAPLGTACQLLAGLEEDPTAQAMRAATAATRRDREKIVKNTFFTRVHIDGLWTSTASDVRIYGLVGSHISLVDVGRVQFFGPPGVILLSVPDESGSRHIRPGYTWGLSVRLGDVRLFSETKNMTLFLTISKVWVTGGSPYDRLQPGGFDIAGFSLAPRKHTK